MRYALVYLLDTNVVIHASAGAEPVLRRLVEHDGALLISTLCLAEVRRGLHAPSEMVALRRRRGLETVMRGLQVVNFDIAAVEAYDRLILDVGYSRRRDFDRMIAAHAISLHAVLVTDNSRDFADIAGLAVENWMAG